MKNVKFTNGNLADSSLMEDWGTAGFDVVSGPHKGHHVIVKTAKADCGAYVENIQCNCSARHENALNGCWQHGHQREESGDSALGELDLYR